MDAKNLQKVNDDPEQKSLYGRITASLLSFCDITSAHGLPHITKSSFILVKLVWLVLFLGALAGISWQLSQVILTYYSYPKQEVSQMSQDPILFPDVTVCNIEPLVAYRAFGQMNDNKSGTYEYTLIKLPEIREFLGNFSTSSLLGKGRIESSKGYYENMPQDEARSIGYGLQDLVVSCNYAGQDCMRNINEHFTYLPDGTYYNCYTFSPKDISDLATGVGPEIGLSLIFYLDFTNGSAYSGTFDQLSNVKQSAGVRVTIHNQDTLPSPLTDGFDIMPGHSTGVALTGVKIERLDPPYGNCSHSKYSSYLPQFKYSASACLMLSVQYHTYTKCGCINVDLPVPYKLINMTYCGFYDYDPGVYVQHLKCAEEAYFEFYGTILHNVTSKLCLPACSDIFYGMVISEALWPHPRYHDSFYAQVVESRPHRDSLIAYTNVVHLKDEGTFGNTTIISDNFARLNVFFKSSETLTRKQVPSYQISDLLSDMGGTIGLWAGLSLITVCEFCTLILRLIIIPFGAQKK